MEIIPALKLSFFLKCIHVSISYIGTWLFRNHVISSCHCVSGECSDSVCDLVSCANGGVCFANRADGYICLCPLGFRGALCEESESTLHSFFSHLHKKNTTTHNLEHSLQIILRNFLMKMDLFKMVLRNFWVMD